MNTNLPPLKLSGLEPLVLTKETNFINIGERTNVTGSRAFLRMIKEGRFEDALSVALEQVQGGAQIIDVNMDEGMIDGKAAMVQFLKIRQPAQGLMGLARLRRLCRAGYSPDAEPGQLA